MGKYKRADFARMCGVTNAYLAVNIKRGKVIVDEFNKIDDTNPFNSDFLQKQIEKNGDPVKIKDKPKEAIKNRSSVQSPEVQEAAYNLEKKKKLIDIEKTTEEVAILRVKKDKLHGVVVPTEMVKTLFAQHTKSIITEFDNSIDKILTKISKKKGLTNKEVAELRGELKDEINIAVDAAIEETKKGIKSIIDEYSETRSRGERA